MAVEEMDAGPFGQKGPQNDFCIQVDGKNLFVSKAVFAGMSPVFEIFCNDEKFVEAQQAKLELKDQNYGEILTMLKSMIPHPTVEPVTEENLEVLLKLGNLYFVRFLQDRCIAFIKHRVKEMKYTDKTSFSYLKMASKYNAEKDLIDLLIRKASNLGIKFLIENGADLQLEIACRLNRHCYLKFENVRHRPTTGRKTSMYCFCCGKWFRTDLCDVCGGSIGCPVCKSGEASCPTLICVQCKKAGCMCKFP